MPNCIFAAIEGVYRRKELRSWAMEFNLSINDTAVDICDPSQGLTIVLITDSYEVYSSDGLLDGIVNKFSCNELSLLKRGLTLGSKIWLLRSRIKSTTPKYRRPADDVVVDKQACQKVDISDMVFPYKLPLGTIHIIQQSKAP